MLLVERRQAKYDHGITFFEKEETMESPALVDPERWGCRWTPCMAWEIGSRPIGTAIDPVSRRRREVAVRTPMRI